MAAVTSTTVVERDGTRHQRVEPGLLTVLADYDIHQSVPQPNDSEGEVLVGGHTLRQRQPDEFDPSLAPHPRTLPPGNNPDWWESTYRNVPSYQPASRELDYDERRQNAVFRAVGTIMVTGCMTIASSAWIWRNTIGRFTDIGLSNVGGEW
ncbi:hypothetical protein ACN47E_008729 [Coniothyrium glycines]